MAESELRCDGCQLVVGSCVETLNCGHYFCHECSCKMEELNATCLLCEYCETEDCDFVSCTEDLPIERNIPVNFNTDMSVDNAELNKQQFPVNESTNLQHVLDVDDLQDDLPIKIDDALAIANERASQLNRTTQMLGKVKARNKVFEENVSRQINEEFHRFFTTLKARKSYLFAELKKAFDALNADIEKAARNLQEQKKDLDARVSFARGLKASPDLTIYCDLNQLVADLMLDCKHEHMIESVNKHPNVRFSINGEMIMNLLGTIGKISFDDADNSQVMPDVGSLLPTKKDSNPLDVEPVYANCTPDAPETTCSINFQSDLVEMVNYEYNMEPDNKPCFKSVDSGHQTASMFSFKIKSLPHMLPSPDIIIEEIIEDEQDSLSDLQVPPSIKCDNKITYPRKFPNTELYSCNAKKLKRSQKKLVSSPPFLQKKSDQGNVELVHLGYIINPCNFYVHRISQNKQLIMLERSLTTLCRIQRHCSPCDVLELGEIIAFRSSKRHTWCRGKITELVPLESKYIQKPCGPTRYRVEDISCITLFLLDYGTSEMFIVTSFTGACFRKGDPPAVLQTKVNDLCPILTKMDLSEYQKLREMDPFAVHCSLDIVPQTPDGTWTKEVKNQILKMINKKTVQMKVLREENKTLIVDLKKANASKMSSDMPASMRDALVFSDFAKFPSQVPGSHENTAVTCYKDPWFPNNTTEVVIVCHMNDPSDFYIHVISESEYVKVVKKIQDLYNQEESDDWKIAYPTIGQACVAKYDTDDDQWYRAEITGLPSPEDVDIKFVDFGNVSRVNVTKLRMLKEEFLALPRKAICCRLAYIQPSYGTAQWSSEACQLFEELTLCKRLRCNFIGMCLENKLSVELFDVNPASAMSINTNLVKNNVAVFISCAPEFGDRHLPLKEVWDTFLDRPVDSMEKCMDTISLSERRDLDVYISHVESPSRIFIQWLSSENILKSLESSMFERYENSKPDHTEWQVDMYVAVRLSIDNIWRRGKIKSIISQQLVEVFCYDFGMEELTNVTNLRTLDDKLKIYGTMCLECTLMDIQPAGGCRKWTATACDFLSFYLNGATAKIIIEENASLWPLPVRILCKNEAGQLVDVSDFLVNKGLALRDRRLKKHDSSMETASKLTGERESVKEANAEPSNAKSDGENKVTSEGNFIESDKSAMDVNIEDSYLPPLIPNEASFTAKVSHVAEDGTIYVIQDCLDNELGILMLDIQNSFKSLGLMAPYNWKKGEGCLIKGSDTMFYRGKILEILGGDLIKVQYEDFGFTEKIPKCHLYPSVYNPNVPRFCIPCQLIDVLPVGDHWQPDAILFLKELLLERRINIHLVEPPKFCGDTASIYLYCGNASVSAILEQYIYCIPKDCERKTKVETQSFSKIYHENIWGINFQELLHSDWDTPILCKYLPLALPSSTEVFEVKVTHLETPNRAFVSIENAREKLQINNNCESDCDPVTSKLKQINEEKNIFRCLTDFRTEMPCLAIYNDRMLHRAKLVAVNKYDPVSFIVEFVDYGSTAVLETCSLFQPPPCLIQYPAKAKKVKLAGFRPPKEDFEKERLPYKQQWSLKAMYAMMDLVQRRTLFAKCLPDAAENTVCLFNEKLQPVYEPLLRMGLADPE